MSFTREDADIAHALHEAYPGRAQHYGGDAGLEREYNAFRTQDEQRRLQQQQQQQQQSEAIEEAEEPAEPIEQIESHHDGRHMSTVTSGSSISSVEREEIGGQPRMRNRRLDSAATITSGTSTQVEDKIMNYLDRHPTAIQRIGDHRLQHSLTVGTTKTGTSQAAKLPNFGGGKPYPQPLPDREEYVVEFDGHDDPMHPQNWPLRQKLIIAGILILNAFGATFASSIFSSASTAVAMQFHVGREVATLGTSLFVLGYAFGPIIFAPMSELYGRRLPLIIAAFGFGIFNIAVAVAKDYQTLMISRFFAGTFGSAPLTIVAAVFSDMFSNEVRGIAVALFSATIMGGPFMGPFIGGFITKSYLGWRWTAYIPGIIGLTACVLAAFFQKETYGPVILVEKASQLRRLTRNWGIHAKQEEVEVDIKELLSKNLSRPIRILFTEPIILIITVYMSFIYGLLYLNLTAYGITYGQIYGFSLGVSGLPYFALLIGVVVGVSIVVGMNGGYVKKLKANNNIPVPEWRLPLAMAGGIVFAIGLFWFGWAGYNKNVSPWASIAAGLFIGFGIYTVFLQCLNYIIDSYLMFAASAIAANTIMRSIFGAVFPLFATYMFEGIGINWGMTLLGFVATAFIPVPFILYAKGKSIRAKSKFAPALDIQQDKRRDEEARMGGDVGGEGEQQMVAAGGAGPPQQEEEQDDSSGTAFEKEGANGSRVNSKDPEKEGKEV
ncbi:hypothetical protein LTR78_004713 [Recurvomyces mirabilis]|uniref:Cercosporin MFS transporter CTB4 n=1 Tax=Recurvomyces mirabilis TaxID=574656 RepID=A0AAE0WPZ1_9PEZI|nr:hypothetical protein LTR78_004713 [Recurvomyces mirabilis]KAK5152793.1 hypothetical protein LTS14_007900 [Recurvomyces mirabilis]